MCTCYIERERERAEKCSLHAYVYGKIERCTRIKGYSISPFTDINMQEDI